MLEKEHLRVLCVFAVKSFFSFGVNIVFYQWDGDDLLLNVRVQPRASSDCFAEILDDRIKLRITAAPVDGKANLHLITFLAKTFKVRKADVSIISGRSGRNKRIRIYQPLYLPEIIFNLR